MNNCRLSPAGYLLQFRFDEAGWNKVINLMKVVPGTGVPGSGRQGQRDHEQESRSLPPARYAPVDQARRR